jgi:hypothetical protein
MYAQLLEGQTLPSRRHELERVIRERLLPALREEEGFSGALHLLDAGTAHTMMIVCWETEEQAVRPFSDYRESTQMALRTFEAASTEFHRHTSVWEICARA